jgi:hypothetical protein
MQEKMKKILFLLLLITTQQNLFAQERVITTGVPFLMIAADARAAGLGDQGVATTSDVYSQQWNPAKYAFATDKQGISISYTPYLTDLVNDISLGQVTYYNRINERSAFAGSLRFFGLGEIELRQTYDDIPQIVKPNELALDGSYSLKLSDHFAMAVGGRYIRSALRIPNTDNSNSKPASTFAIDISGFFQSEEIALSDFSGRWRAGFNFQNMGPKINYDAGTSTDNTANFLPANLRLGVGYDFLFDEYNKVAVNLEFAKLLVPTPPAKVTAVDSDGDGEISTSEQATADSQYANSLQDYKKIGWVSGMFKSFNDAPDGFSEELKEFTYSLSSEYTYDNSFALRLGYFHESPLKGARQFFSMGAGFTYNTLKVDLSYLFSASKVKNPLENTLRFSLTFNFGDQYDDY